MHIQTAVNQKRRFNVWNVAARLVMVLLVAALFAPQASAAVMLDIAGYFDFIYGRRALDEPTDGRPESKLWYNDGRWWGIMFNPATEAYHIYWLDWKSQTWKDTGTQVDERNNSRSDVLWDEANNKLYVASHVKQDNPGQVNSSANWARLYRFTYDAATKAYILDANFPALISQHRTKAMVLDKDATGKLWLSYVSKDLGTGNPYQVYVNRSGEDHDWDADWVLGAGDPDFAVATNLTSQDISSVITFTDESGPRVGVMWSNATTGKFYFASRPADATAEQTGWVLETLPAELDAYPSNDQINLKKDSQGRLFAAIKTHADLMPNPDPNAPLIAVVARDRDGTFSFHPAAPVSSADTRAIVVVHEGAPASGDEQLFLFVTSNPTGGAVCYQTAAITPVLADIAFPYRSCGDPGLAGATQVLADTRIYNKIDNSTSTKQVLNNNTDIVILAGDQSDESYVHAAVINPPPIITSRSPVGPTLFSVENMTVRVTFNRQMNASTVNTSTLRVSSSAGQVSGTVAYNPANHTATFTPNSPLQIDTRYTVTVTDSLLDITGQPLLDSPHEWTFRLVPHNIFLPGLYN